MYSIKHHYCIFMYKRMQGRKRNLNTTCSALAVTHTTTHLKLAPKQAPFHLSLFLVHIIKWSTRPWTKLWPQNADDKLAHWKSRRYIFFFFFPIDALCCLLFMLCRIPQTRKVYVIRSSFKSRRAIGLFAKSVLPLEVRLLSSAWCGLTCGMLELAILWLLVLAAGTSWLCLPSYVVMTALGSVEALSTCLRTLHPGVVHL